MTPDNPSPPDPTGPNDDSTHRAPPAADHTTLNGNEALGLMRESGGFAVVRWDCGHAHIDYRYNPLTDEYEQLYVTLDAGGDDQPTQRVESYYRLPTDYAADLLRTPGDADLLTLPEVLRYDRSHFARVNTNPDQLVDNINTPPTTEDADDGT